MEPLAAPKGSSSVALRQADISTTETTAPLSKRKKISSPFALPVTGVPSSPGDSGPWFCCSEYSPARFGHVAGDSPVECDPDHRNRSIPLPSERDASGTAYLVSPPACPGLNLIVIGLPQPCPGRRQLLSADLPRSQLRIPPAAVPIRGSPAAADGALYARPMIKWPTSSLSDFPALRPTSSTSRAKSRMGWFRCFRRQLKRISSRIGNSQWPYVASMQRLSSQELSRVGP
ncbi:hypothetical protein Tsp_09136 [Trichinella spiralis]|uniref:hypothetical protein n=1 Tax=Trichinella spiralis TaxID=6334 RepID=UPI0001EFCB7A|nr:hypothetical protein Tsp_09136 [Trichinella spiralis]